MPAWVLPAIAGVASLAGGAWSNKAARDEAERNRQFQERMSSTSWQRGVEDMRAAGLNPALAYGAGGASAPGGSMASQSDMVSPAASSAMAAARLRQELRVMRETEERTYNEALLARNSALESAARTQRIYLEQRREELNNKLLELQLPWQKAVAGAASKFPEAALLKLIFQSGGAGLIGSITGAATYAGSRLKGK